MSTALEFQRRRRRAGFLAAPWLIVGVVGLVVTNYFSVWKDAREVISIAFFAVAIIGAIIGIRIYRCPNCDKVPMDDGLPFSPTTCPSCGVLLK
jgi:uncharacterized membrane protein YeaQ/YmgE (transglycosylase-associated protein family)